MPRVGFNAQQVHQGMGQRGATMRQGERLPGPSCPDTRAKPIVTWHVRDLEAMCNGAMRALAKVGVLGPTVTGLAEGPDLETTAHDTGGGQVTRQVRSEDTQGRVPESAGAVYGWKGRRLIAAATKRPLAVQGGTMQDHEALWAWALVPQARRQLAGDAPLPPVVLARGLVAGTPRRWLEQHPSTWVMPAKDHMAVTADARAQAMAGAGPTVGRRVHPVRHGLGKIAWTERLATAVVGIRELTTDD
jgi:hypothetical protein